MHKLLRQGDMLGTLSLERRLVPGAPAHGHASTCRRPLLLSVCSSMPLVVVFRAPAHRVAVAALSLPALPPEGGALLRVSAPVTLAALDGVCSSLIRAQQHDSTMLRRLILSVSISTFARGQPTKQGWGKSARVGLPRDALQPASRNRAVAAGKRRSPHPSPHFHP